MLACHGGIGASGALCAPRGSLTERGPLTLVPRELLGDQTFSFLQLQL